MRCPNVAAFLLVAFVFVLSARQISSSSSSSSGNNRKNASASGNNNNNHNAAENCTDLARDDETLLVFSTLGGGLTAVDPITSEIRWSIEDEPAISVPTEGFANPQYLPDPRDGSLYQLGHRGGLKKLPFTIPQLVANAPCRSSDGILYSGKKSDTWYLIDPKTGRREKVLDFGDVGAGAAAAAAAAAATPDAFVGPRPKQRGGDKIGWATSRAGLYLGRTQYTVLMYDSMSHSANTKPWNVTFFDYSAHTMAPEVSKEYEYLHMTASAGGLTVTLDRKKGTFMWMRQLETPVVAAFLLGPDGLLSVPFTTVSDDTLASIVEFARDGQKNDIKLFQTLYVGEHTNGLYAIPSLADRNVARISADAPANLINGPRNADRNSAYLSALLESVNGDDDDDDDDDQDDDDDDASDDNVILLGHYQMPQLKTDMKLSLSSSAMFLGKSAVDDVAVGSSDLATRYEANGFEVININKNSDDGAVIRPPQYDSGDVDRNGRPKIEGSSTSSSSSKHAATKSNRSMSALSPTALKMLYSKSTLWLNDQESKILKMLLIILMGMIVAMFWYMRHTVRELRQSQSGSNTGSSAAEAAATIGGGQFGAVRAPGSSYQEPIDLGDGDVRVGKIVFNSGQVLGKGCEGTFVFRGSFEQRAVAVKRLLPECFTLADREVALLRESDAHENVVRYFCTEQDRQFRYIAVELCAATLQDYIESGVGGELRESLGVLEVLRQATNGLMHLHSLSIVHRDIKPQNVLLSLPAPVGGQVRAMISDFGLCKKLNLGRTSFSRRSGVTGTEGWIAPEMLKGQRTTTSVDIFSLGCVYYYVLSNGRHPFGDAVKRQANILAFDYDLSIFHSGQPEESSKILAEQLITAMIAKDPATRPPARAILNHPFFWSADRVLAFLQDVSDRVEKLDFAVNPLRTLEKNGRLVVRDDWSTHLHESIRADLRKYRGYHGNSVRDLMRALRNKKHHYHELSADMQATLGAVPLEFTRYWVQRFPHLVAHAFHALETCAKENAMRSYYTEGYTFPKAAYFALPDQEFVPAETSTKLPAAASAAASIRRYPKDLRQRLVAAATMTTTASSAEAAEQQVDGSPRTNRRGAYNFGKPAELSAKDTVETTNWRKKKEPAATPAWTMTPTAQK